MELRYRFLIEPVAKARPRFSMGRVYTPAKTVAFESQIKNMIRADGRITKPIDYPVTIAIIFELQRPKRPKFPVPAVRPDLDNYIKAVLDAMNGVLLADDGLVCDITAIKRYGDTPSIWLRIADLPLDH